MSKINEAIHTIHYLDRMSLENKWINNIHPLAKLVVTFVYISVLISFNKYNLSGLAGMSIYSSCFYFRKNIIEAEYKAVERNNYNFMHTRYS